MVVLKEFRKLMCRVGGEWLFFLVFNLGYIFFLFGRIYLLTGLVYKEILFL